MHTLPRVIYTPAEDGTYFLKLLDHVLARTRPVRTVSFGLSTPHMAPDKAIIHTVPRFALGLEGNHVQLVANGQVQCEIPIRRGEVVFFPPMGWNIPKWKSSYRFLSVVFFRDYTRFLHGSWEGTSQPCVTYHHTILPLGGTVNHLASALVAASYHGGETSGARAMAEALLWELRTGLALQGRKRSRKSQQTWQTIACYLQEHLNQPISLSLIADYFGLHPAHVSRLARSIGREGFNNYVTRLRMERAQWLIAKGGIALQDVALACGFADYGYFRKVFRHFFGMPPSRSLNQVTGIEGKQVHMPPHN